MLGFRYKKLYVDVVTEQGSVGVLYATWLDLPFSTLSSAGYEHYAFDRLRRVERAIERPELVRDGDRLRLRFATKAGEVALALHGARTEPSAHQLTPALRWEVLAERAEVALTGSGAPALAGIGYADWVEMSRPPRALGLATLEWGRAHWNTEAFVFARASFTDQREFRCSLLHGEASQSLSLRDLDGERWALEVEGERYMLERERVLHAGPALDEARFPGVLERRLARALGGPMSEQRCFGRLRTPDGTEGRALYERVRFGAR